MQNQADLYADFLDHLYPLVVDDTVSGTIPNLTDFFVIGHTGLLDGILQLRYVFLINLSSMLLIDIDLFVYLFIYF